jgi:hypothetical protein
MSNYLSSWISVLGLFVMVPATGCETQITQPSDGGVCVPLSGELCAAPISIWVEDNDLVREVIGTGACSFQTRPSADGVRQVDGTLHQSGTCHIVVTAMSGAVDVHDVAIGPVVQSAYCGCANYPKTGSLSVLAFSKRAPTFGADGQCQCPSDRYCYNGSARCTPGLATSQCLLRPTTCASEEQSVCGCDGKLYANECLAYQAGTNVALANECTLPDNRFACGDAICTREEQICQVLYSPERMYESYRCNSGLACRKSFSDTCGCPSTVECTCTLESPGAVNCRSKV